MVFNSNRIHVLAAYPIPAGTQASVIWLKADSLQEFLQFLEQNDPYVFTINGFPYGPFHGVQVKEDVYLSDGKNE